VSLEEAKRIHQAQLESEATGEDWKKVYERQKNDGLVDDYELYKRKKLQEDPNATVLSENDFRVQVRRMESFQMIASNYDIDPSRIKAWEDRTGRTMDSLMTGGRFTDEGQDILRDIERASYDPWSDPSNLTYANTLGRVFGELDPQMGSVASAVFTPIMRSGSSEMGSLHWTDATTMATGVLGGRWAGIDWDQRQRSGR
jgi:hypothetical protein